LSWVIWSNTDDLWGIANGDSHSYPQQVALSRCKWGESNKSIRLSGRKICEDWIDLLSLQIIGKEGSGWESHGGSYLIRLSVKLDRPQMLKNPNGYFKNEKPAHGGLFYLR